MEIPASSVRGDALRQDFAGGAYENSLNSSAGHAWTGMSLEETPFRVAPASGRRAGIARFLLHAVSRGVEFRRKAGWRVGVGLGAGSRGGGWGGTGARAGEGARALEGEGGDGHAATERTDRQGLVHLEMIEMVSFVPISS